MTVALRCDGLCMTAADMGVFGYGDMIAQAHPQCPLHGEPDDVPLSPEEEEEVGIEWR